MHKLKYPSLLPFAAFISFMLLIYAYINIQPNLRDNAIDDAINLDAAPFIEALEHENNIKLPQSKAMVIEVFASWCGACILNHAQLVELAPQINVPIYGVAISDKPDTINAWLKRHGNPFAQILLTKGYQHLVKIGITSLPETFIVDENHNIVFKFKGVVNIPALKDAIHKTITRSS